MNPIATVVLSVLLSSAGAYAVCALTSAPPRSAGDAADLEPLAVRDEQTTRRLAEMERRLDAVEAGPAARELATPASGLTDAQIADAFTKWMAEQGGVVEASRRARLEGAAADQERAFQEIYAKLRAPGLGYEAREALWKEAKKRGVLRQLLEAYQSAAKARPNDPDAQSQLGVALLQMCDATTDQSEQGRLADAADKTFDKALALNPEHWEARFTKATALSFWPPIFGKGPEAVGHFETLIEQQKRSPRKPEHAQSYVFLGNLYEQQGKKDKARALWTEAATLFPEHEELRRKSKQ